MKRFNWLFILLFFAVIPAMADGPRIVEPGYHQTPFVSDEDEPFQVGFVEMWNTPQSLEIKVHTTDGWLISDKLRMFIHHDLDQVPLTKKGGLEIKSLPYEWKIDVPVDFMEASFDLQDDLEFNWGKPWYDEHVKYIAVYTEAIKFTEDGMLKKDVWAYGGQILPGSNTAMAVPYPLYHPSKGHFIDSPVGGATVISKTFNGKTDASGGFDYFPGERVELFVGHLPLGDALAAHKISPLDIFESADTDDPRVINMARLLQSLDVDASPKDGIMFTEAVEFCLFEATGGAAVDFSNDAQIESVIQGTITACAEQEVNLVAVSAEDAKENLDRSLDSTMFRKKVSKTPDLTSSKSKLNIMGVWFPALKANGEPFVYTDENGAVQTGIPYYDENGDLIRVADQAKPIVLAYTDGVEETGYEDIFAAISRDDGNTFKRKNLSRAADKSSFTLENGTEYFGQAKKPVFHVKGNNILIAWTSKFCKGGKPTYAITTCDDPDTEEVEVADPESGLCRITCTGDGENEVCEPDYPYDDPYFEEDIWGVGGPQRSVDYTDQGFPEVGEVPYSCVWTARGTILTEKMLTKAPWNSKDVNADPLYAVGDIVWFKPERLTSGRRDANQVFMGGADGAGFAIAWQEDPEGLRPGDAAGPGPGWGGATTNHKTDIWYSYITMQNFAQVDLNFESGGDPQHEDPDLIGRYKAKVPMSLPVRLSDNDAVNTDNLLVDLGADGYPIGDTPADWTPIPNPDAESDDGDGTHAYGYKIPGLCDDFYEFINYQGVTKRVCITEDGRLLDGDTGASRPNLFLQTYTKPDGTKSAWAIMAYEETKGAGIGPPDHEEGEGPYGDEPVPEEGKNAIYLSFDFQTPPKVSAGNIINLPERVLDENGDFVEFVYLKDEEGNLILDWMENPILAYENARRPRFILQGKSAAIPPVADSRTVLLILYKEGVEGHGRPSDILMRRIVASDKGNPYAFKNIVCNATAIADNGLEVCVDGTMNMSSVTPTVTTESMGDPEQEDPYGAVKVVEWEQTVDNFADPTYLNPYDDARAHRGQIRGDWVIMGYSYTPNWAAARNGNDQYDFFVRRSFDGGVTWTTDPNPELAPGDEDYEPYETCQTWTDPLTKEKTEECNTYLPGDFEQARNVSQLKNAKSSVIEPRIVCPGGTIKVDGVWTGIPEDKQNKNVCYVAYGTSTNPKKDPVTGEQEAPVPEDLYYSWTHNRGENLELIEWVVSEGSAGFNAGETILRWDYIAKGDAEQGEVQLRMTPDGSRFYMSWLEEGADGSDIMFRRIMPSTFDVNVAPAPTE